MKNLKKVIAVLLAVVTVAFAFAACSGSKTDKSTSDYDKVVKSGKIVVGVTVYEPMDYKDKDGNWTGFDAELAEAVAKKMGVRQNLSQSIGTTDLQNLHRVLLTAFGTV